MSFSFRRIVCTVIFCANVWLILKMTKRPSIKDVGLAWWWGVSWKGKSTVIFEGILLLNPNSRVSHGWLTGRSCTMCITCHVGIPLSTWLPGRLNREPEIFYSIFFIVVLSIQFLSACLLFRLLKTTPLNDSIAIKVSYDLRVKVLFYCWPVIFETNRISPPNSPSWILIRNWIKTK